MSAYTIQAQEPTLLDNQTHYDLAGIDLMIGFKVDTAHIIPDNLDIDRFNSALARTLSKFPTHAGRIERPREDGQHWRIHLTNDGVPVIIEDSDALIEVPRNTVIQNPWTLTKGVNLMKYLDFHSDEPIMRVTITRFIKTGATSIGLSASHVVGDGFVMYQFARLLSQNYQGLEPLDEPPNYSSVPTLPESVDVRSYGKIPMPSTDNLYPLREVAPHSLPGRVRPGRIDVRLTCNQVKQLQAGAQNELRESDPEVVLSRQDVIAGILVYCMSHAEPTVEPIQFMSNIFMCRGIPPRPVSSIGNRLVWAVTDPATDFASETIATISRRVRLALVRARDPGFLDAYDALHEEVLTKIARADLAQDFLQRPGYMILNSTWKFDWTSAHFGYPGKTRFCHTLLDGPRFVKIFRPNPTLLPDGSWLTRTDDAEITLYITKEARERFKELFVREAKHLGVTGDIEFLDH